MAHYESKTYVEEIQRQLDNLFDEIEHIENWRGRKFESFDEFLELAKHRAVRVSENYTGPKWTNTYIKKIHTATPRNKAFSEFKDAFERIRGKGGKSALALALLVAALGGSQLS